MWNHPAPIAKLCGRIRKDTGLEYIGFHGFRYAFVITALQTGLNERMWLKYRMLWMLELLCALTPGSTRQETGSGERFCKTVDAKKAPERKSSPVLFYSQSYKKLRDIFRLLMALISRVKRNLAGKTKGIAAEI